MKKYGRNFLIKFFTWKQVNYTQIIQTTRKTQCLKKSMNIADYDPVLWQAIQDENRRQEEHIELSHLKTMRVHA